MATTFKEFYLEDNLLSAGQSTTLHIVFGQRVVGFTPDSLGIKGGSLSNLQTSDNGKSWTATVTASDDTYNGKAVITVFGGTFYNGEDFSPGSGEGRVFDIDSTAPLAPTIELPNAGPDGVYNKDEVNDNGTVTATITLPTSDNEFETTKPGDVLIVNGEEITITQDMIDNGYEVEVEPGTEPTDITVSIRDEAGNVGEATTQQLPAADLVAPDKPIVTFTQDKDDDGVINTDELNGNDSVEYTVAIGDDVQVGDTLIVNGTEITVTDAIKQAGSYTGTLPAIDGESVEVVAQFIDQAGNPSEVTTDTATLDLAIPDADPIYLWHLGANLSNIEGPSDARGKFGGCYGDEINYETGNLNDAIYIGYTGRDAHGKLIVSPWDGDFERDAGDGNVVWTMETYAGNDLVYIREDQNAYTSTKLGSGDDIYYAQGELGANFSAAQHDQNARAYVYTETGDDTVVIGGNGEGKVTGWGIDGGRIFTGSGSDNVTIYGEVDDGGVIDLGAGRTEYAPDDQAASTVDQAGDVNNVTITHNLGNAGHNDYGRIFGGAGDDNVTIGTFVEGRSVINLGEGTNSVTIGDDLDGHSKVITGSGDDTLTIGDDTEDYSSIDLGDGNNVINIASTVEDHSIIRTGNGNDVLNVGYAIANNSYTDLGAGDDKITVGDDIDGAAVVVTGSGNDIVTVGDDLEDVSEVWLGEGDDIINVADTLEDRSMIVAGDGEDVLNVGGNAVNTSVSYMGDGNDIVKINGKMFDCASTDLGDGNDQISVGGMYHYSKIKAGAGDDVIDLGDTFNTYTYYDHVAVQAGEGDDTITFNGGKMNGVIDGGTGVDTLIMTFDDNSSLVSKNAHETNLSTKNITGIEVVELNGKNAFDVRFADLMNDTSREGALFIKGDSDSKVDLGSTNWNSDNAWQAQSRDATGGNWSKADTATVDGVNYDVYHNSMSNNAANDVYIEQGIVVI